MLAPKSTGKPPGKRKKAECDTHPQLQSTGCDRLRLHSSFSEDSSSGSACESQVSYLANRAVLLRS